ncbi:MAG: hypothetical protein HYZ14_12220 [Bacteroidetes bacterium]|nr:hypothetical protein [Bacteroidota bacterium]
MRLFFLTTALVGITLAILLSAKHKGISQAPGASVQTAMCTPVQQPADTAQKPCSTLDFAFTGYSGNAINTEKRICCNSTVNGLPLFTHGELKHHLCALEVRRNAKEIKDREFVFSEWVAETPEVPLCQ